MVSCMCTLNMSQEKATTACPGHGGQQERFWGQRSQQVKKGPLLMVTSKYQGVSERLSPVPVPLFSQKTWSEPQRGVLAAAHIVLMEHGSVKIHLTRRKWKSSRPQIKSCDLIEKQFINRKTYFLQKSHGLSTGNQLADCITRKKTLCFCRHYFSSAFSLALVIGINL